MARDYSRTEVLDIIEKEAGERGIPRDDFMRFAYIETGGTFNEQASRGPNGAKGLFQFVPDTADAYRIRGRELDAVANTDAAAQLYLDNRNILVNRHARDAQPYLSGKAEPDGLDMYMAHQQGAGGYRSIQTALATGHFGRDDTRSNLLNNVSPKDFETVTGTRYADFAKMSDKDMATRFTHYWDAKFDRVRIPEKGIEPVSDQARSQAAPATTSPQPATTPDTNKSGIGLAAAYDLSVKFDDVKYKMGAKHPEQGVVDCSGWVATMQNATMKEINEKAGREVFTLKDRFNLGNDGAAMIVEKGQARSGVMIEGKAVNRDVLKEGMIIGEDNGAKSWDKGRFKGIDHITMVVRDPKSGELMISQSRGKEGVELSSMDKYLEYKQSHGVKLYATDPLAKARDLLQDRQQTQGQSHSAERSAASADGPLRKGAHGDDVKGLQQSLNRLGVHDANGRPLREDSDYGDRTREAVMAYQKANGLKVDGVAGPETLGNLGRHLPAGQVTVEAKINAPVALTNPAHPDHGLHTAVSGQLPAHVSADVAANVTAHTKQAGIDHASKLQSVTVQDNTAFVSGTTPGFRAKVDLAQPVPTMEQTSAQLLADNTSQQKTQEPQQVAMPGR